MSTTSDEFDEGVSYDLAEIVPIPAKCTGCGFDWVGRDAIRAPSLDNCSCAWCWNTLRPHPNYPPVVDAVTARAQGGRQAELIAVSSMPFLRRDEVLRSEASRALRFIVIDQEVQIDGTIIVTVQPIPPVNGGMMEMKTTKRR